MQTEIIKTESFQFDLIAPEEISAELLNAKGAELGLTGIRLGEVGVSMLCQAVALGALLEAKREHVEKVGGNWKDWQEHNLKYSRQSADNYCRLFRGRDKVAAAITQGLVSSIRTALELLRREPGLETPLLPGFEEPAPVAVKTKTEGLFGRIWRVFKEPTKTPEPERNAFLMHTAASCRLAKEHGWELPGVTIDITTQEKKL